MDLGGKVAIVTGSGGRGTGRATAQRFARRRSRRGQDVNDSGGRETVALIEAEGGHVAFCRTDVRIESDIRALIRFAESTFGGLDVLVNNASSPDGMEFLTEWMNTMAIEILGPMHATLAAIEAMRRRGGAIVNIGSTSALGHGRKHSAWPAYDVGKMAQMRLTTTLACLRDQENIRVNCLVPAWIASPGPKEFWESLTPDQRRDRGVPDALLSLDEISGAILRLATDEKLFGRMMVWWNGQPPQLISEGDQGYLTLGSRGGSTGRFTGFGRRIGSAILLVN